MGKVIKLQVNNKEYILQFNRKSILLAEGIKDVPNDYEKVVALVQCAFLKNHPDITKKEVEEIIEEIGDLEGFMKALTSIIEDCVNTLDKKQGNAHWEVA